MANESTTTTLNDLLPSIVAEALFVAQEQSIMRGLVRNYPLGMASGNSVTVPIYPKVPASAVAEGTDLANTVISTSSAVLTVSEIGTMATVTDLARRTSSSNVVADIGRLLGEGIAEKIDTDLIALFDSFTTNTVGDGLGNISAASIFQAVTKLRSAGWNTAGMSCVLHPEIAYDLKSTMTNTFADPSSQSGNEAMRSGFVGMIAGVPVYESGLMADTGAAGDYKGGLFHRDALGIAVLEDISIETQRDASLRADEIVAVATVGTGILQEAAGVEVYMQSSINP